MSLKTIQALLDLTALCNSHCNHGFSFEFVRLKDSLSVSDAVNAYFSSYDDQYDASDWHIEIKHPQEIARYHNEHHIEWRMLQGSSYEQLVYIIQGYLFGLYVHLGDHEEVTTHEWLRKAVAEMICQHIVEEVGDEFILHEITTEPPFKPPFCYEAHWRDFVITSNKGNWLFHIADND